MVRRGRQKAWYAVPGENRTPAGSGGAAEAPTGVPRHVQLIELLLFLFLVLPSLMLSTLYIAPERLSFPLVATATMFRDMGLIALVFYFVWRNGEGLGAVGWRWQQAWTEILFGVVAYLALVYALILIATVLYTSGVRAPAEPPHFLIPTGPSQIALAIVFVAVVAVTEEVIFRGYLLLRLIAVTGSRTLAIGLSALVFGLGHLYEGPVAALVIALMGTAFAVIYLWRGSLVAPITMHFLQDLLGVVIIPLFKD